MKPSFEIIANGENISALISDRLLSLGVYDEEGMSADRFEMTIDDRDNRITLPETGATIQISLGMLGSGLTDLGVFVVDRISGTGPRHTLTIGGAANDLAGVSRAPKTRAWENKKLGEIATIIAKEAGLTLAISNVADGIVFPYIAQTAESDMHFLTRIAKDHDLIAKPVSGHLTLLKRGETLSAAPVAELSTLDIGDWSWSRGERDQYRSVECEWHDLASGQTKTIRLGSGEPIKTLRHRFASEGEARMVGESHLTVADREAFQLKATGTGFLPTLFAGGSVSIEGLRTDLSGEWLIDQAEHRLDARALKTAFTCRKANGEVQ